MSLGRSRTCAVTRRPTPGRSPSCATSARRASRRPPTCGSTCRSTSAKYAFPDLGNSPPTQNKREIYECNESGCNKKYFYLCNLKKHRKEHAEEEELPAPDAIEIAVCIAGCRFVFAVGGRQPGADDGLILPASPDAQPGLNTAFYDPASDVPTVLAKSLGRFLEGPFRRVYVRLPEDSSPPGRIVAVADTLIKEVSSRPDRTAQEVVVFDLRIEEFAKAAEYLVDKSRRRLKDERPETKEGAEDKEEPGA